MSVLVVGDVMLDVYVEGEINRVNPEAPAPLMVEKKVTKTPGGAANVACNIISMGGQCKLIGGIGGDGEGNYLEHILIKRNIVTGFLKNAFGSTTTKTRFVHQGQQMLRVDKEGPSNRYSFLQQEILQKVEEHITDTKVMVISDYMKGFMTEETIQAMILLGLRRQMWVLVDPKGDNWSKYRDAVLIKPNAEELSKAVDLPTDTREQCLTAAAIVSDKFNIPFILVTRGSKGMILYTATSYHEFGAQIVPVADVVGAGDTALAALAVGLSEGLAAVDAIHLANAAAGIAVSKPGTATVSRQEIKDAFVRTESAVVG